MIVFVFHLRDLDTIFYQFCNVRDFHVLSIIIHDVYVSIIHPSLLNFIFAFQLPALEGKRFPCLSKVFIYVCLFSFLPQNSTALKRANRALRFLNLTIISLLFEG